MSRPSSPASTAEQRRLAERYLLERPVGRGGAGVVWQATDELLGRTVAIKECMLPPTVDDADRDKLLSRVMREARTAARLDHPALVTVFDVVQESGRPWIVMEYVESRSLAQVVREDGPLPPLQVVDIGLTLLDALHVAHSAGVMHRDVKPANVLLTKAGTVVLTDFGIAASTGDPTLTTSGMLLGSPSYMSPERARGEAATAASDIWSLAATLYTLVEGVTPYTGEHPLAVLSAVADGRRRPMEVAGPLEPLLAEILDSEPDKRPTGTQTRRRLERIRADLAQAGPATTGGTPIRTLGSVAGLSAAEQTSRFAARRRRKRQEKEATNGGARPTAPAAGPAAGAAIGAGAAASAVEAAAPPAVPAPEAEAPEAAAPEAAAPEIAAPEIATPEAAAPEVAVPTEASAPPAAPAPTAPTTPEPREQPAAHEALAAPPPTHSPASTATPDTKPADHRASNGGVPASSPSAPTRPADPDRPSRRPTPPPPSRSRPARSTSGRRRRGAAILGAGALALVVLLVVVLLLVHGNGSHPSPAAAPSALPSASASATGASSPSSPASPSASSGAAVPAGWQVVTGSSGWKIAVPPGFTRSQGRSANQTDFRNADGILLRVEIAPKANASAIGDWRKYEPIFARQVSNYQRVRIDPADGGDGTQIADWEFTFNGGSSQLHVLNQGKIDGRSAHALYWQTPESIWAASQQMREQVFATFQPPPQ